MALLPSGQTYNWYFDNVDQVTNITYNAKFYGFKVIKDPSYDGEYEHIIRSFLPVHSDAFVPPPTVGSICHHQPQLHPESGQFPHHRQEERLIDATELQQQPQRRLVLQ